MNFLAESKSLFQSMYQDRLFLATVTAKSVNQITVKRSGQSAADGQSYPSLAGTTASITVGGTVVVARVGAGYVVLGQVVT
jgi:hypothetical protein